MADEKREQSPKSTGPGPGPSDAGTKGKATGEPTPAAPSKGTPMTQQLGRVVLIAAAVLFGIFAVTNAQYVEFNWVFGGTEVVERGGERVSGGVPLIVLLVVSFATGALIAWIATVRSERRKR